MYAARAHRPGPQGAALAVGDGGGLDGCSASSCPTRTPAARAGWLVAGDLHFGAVDAQFDSLGGGVGEHVSQTIQPQARLVGDGEATAGQQRPDLVHGAGDGGAVNAVQHSQGLVRQLQAQDHQRDQHAVTKTSRWWGRPRRRAGLGGRQAMPRSTTPIATKSVTGPMVAY